MTSSSSPVEIIFEKIQLQRKIVKFEHVWTIKDYESEQYEDSIKCDDFSISGDEQVKFSFVTGAKENGLIKISSFSDGLLHHPVWVNVSLMEIVENDIQFGKCYTKDEMSYK